MCVCLYYNILKNIVLSSTIVLVAVQMGSYSKMITEAILLILAVSYYTSTV